MKLYDDRFQFSGLHPGQLAACRLRVYRDLAEGRPVGPWLVVATEVADNPGSSITNAAEQLCTEVWQLVCPNAAHPPMLFDHYDSGSYHHHRRGDEFSLLSWGQVHGLRYANPKLRRWAVSEADWQWWPGAMVRRLVADPSLGDGFDEAARTSGATREE